MRSKAEMMAELRTMLRDVFAARSEGAAYARLARAHGYVDGYMRAMMEAGVIGKDGSRPRSSPRSARSRTAPRPARSAPPKSPR